MVVPELILYNYVESLLKYVEKDWNETVDKTKTFLGRIYENKVFQKNTYVHQASEIFTRKKDDPRKIKVNLSFNLEQILSNPTICITLAGEQDTQNELGLGESGEFYMNDVDQISNSINENRLYRFQGTYNIIISSQNEIECLIMYRTMQALIIAGLDTLILQGLPNPKLSGSDIRLDSEKLPNQIFMKNVTISTFHELKTPQIFPKQIIEDLIIDRSIINE